MPEPKDALDEFNEDFPKGDESVDPFAETRTEKTVPEKEETTEEDDVAKIKERDNREAKRAKRALQAEREANIALTERIKVLSEVQKFNQETGSSKELASDITRIYGNDTPEAREASRILKEALDRNLEQAEERALRRLQEVREAEVVAQKEAESFIDNELAALEDEYDVDLTSDSPAGRKHRREFLELVQKASPKDQDGNIKEYADFSEIFEIYQSRLEKPDNSRQRQVASRSMTRSGSSSTQKSVEQTSNEQWLKDRGII